MRSITLKSIHKSFGKEILAGVSFSLSEGKKLALVGQNGSGKSTLLRIVTGNLEPDKGEILGLENHCAFIAQDFSGRDNETPFQFLSRRVPERSIGEAVKKLGHSGFEMGKDETKLKQVKCGDLSGGEKKKLEIVAGLASGSLFIAMDEPENHLDVHTIEWLIGELSKFHGGLLMVSHDSYFIDQLSDTVIELENGNVTVYTKKYHEYLEEKIRQINGRGQVWEAEEKEIKRLHKSLETLKLQAKGNSSRAATYQQAKRRLAEKKESHGKKPTVEQKKPKVSLSSVDQKKGKQIVSVDHIDFKYGQKQIFWDATAHLCFGEKVILYGPNGSGKSTLANIITGTLSPMKGTARIGVNVKWQFMTQDHLEGLNPEHSALDVFGFILRWPETKSRGCLARYGITSDLVTKPLKSLSGGQQARFKLALTFAQEPEFLILDEPTNHVDPSTWEAIVEAIKAYPGTVLAITHDREFIDEIAQKLWVLKDRQIFVEYGNLSEYLNRSEE